MIADGAQAVIDRCPANSIGQINGQSEYDGGWSVLLVGNSC